MKNATERSFERNNEKEVIWKRLQDDRKAEKIKREAIKKQNEEQEVHLKKIKGIIFSKSLKKIALSSRKYRKTTWIKMRKDPF